MKKKTSIFLFKLWLAPTLVLGTSYAIFGTVANIYSATLPNVEAKAFDEKVISGMHSLANEHATLLSALGAIYLIWFFGLIVLNASFWGTLLFNKSGFPKLLAPEYYQKFVRNNTFMFWDEVVNEVMKGDRKR